MTEQYTKYRNILSIKLVKNFVPYTQKISIVPDSYKKNVIFYSGVGDLICHS
ncbi:MAG: hypothetical protein ACRYE8_00140 [Janthinobacterium lividum]